MKQLLNIFIILVGLLSGAQAAIADLVLGKFWESETISGYSGKKMLLNFGEFTVYENVDQSHRISTQDTTSGSDGGGSGGTSGGSMQHEGMDEHTAFSGLRKITWHEDKDKPCHMVVHSFAIETVPGSPEDKVNDICKGDEGNKKIVTLANNEFATGVSVCTTDKKDTTKNRLKGIRLYSSVIDNDGNVSSTGGYQGNRHTNCKVWRAPAKCPADHIVTSLKIYSKDNSYTGLGIKCRKVETASSPYK